jgi:hypothetical protein
MPDLKETVSQAQLVHEVKRGRMNGVSPEVSVEIRVSFE